MNRLSISLLIRRMYYWSLTKQKCDLFVDWSNFTDWKVYIIGGLVDQNQQKVCAIRVWNFINI
jgi:hypothetical protein